MTPEQINQAIAEVTGKELPYDSCLNAMHEAEKVLTEPQQELYGGFLHSGRLCQFNAYCTEWSWNLIHTTPAQRAEAFLRTIGKWKD